MYNVGNKVQVVYTSNLTGIEQKYFLQDVGIVIEASQNDNTTMVDFNGQGNPRVVGGGQWWVTTIKLELRSNGTYYNCNTFWRNQNGKL